jgi:hypothetical protein
MGSLETSLTAAKETNCFPAIGRALIAGQNGMLC